MSSNYKNIYVGDNASSYSDIQSAIDSLPSEGGVIYIRPGIYNISSALTITKSNISLIGSGGSTIFKLANKDTNIIKVGGVSSTSGVIENILISNIRFEGKNLIPTSGSLTSNGILFESKYSGDDTIRHVIVEKCFFSNFYYRGIFGNNGRFDNNCGLYEKKFEFFNIKNNIFSNCFHGIAFSGIKLSRFSGNIGYNLWKNQGGSWKGGATVYLWGSDQCVVYGNIGNNNKHGVILERANSHIVIANCISNSKAWGINAQQGRYRYISDDPSNHKHEGLNNIRSNTVENSGIESGSLLPNEIQIRSFDSGSYGSPPFGDKPETFTLLSANNVRHNLSSTVQRDAIKEENYSASSDCDYNFYVMNKATGNNNVYTSAVFLIKDNNSVEVHNYLVNE